MRYAYTTLYIEIISRIYNIIEFELKTKKSNILAFVNILSIGPVAIALSVKPVCAFVLFFIYGKGKVRDRRLRAIAAVLERKNPIKST